MRPTDILSLDLNLLLSLHWLLETKSVSAAAQKVGLSQPAMSRNLGRLRDSFGDPLLVRSGNTMLPTPRAEALALPLGSVLEQVHALVNPAEFVPEHGTQEWKLACTDYASRLLMPGLAREMCRDAHQMKLQLVTWDSSCLDALAGKELDVGIGIIRRDVSGIFRTTLFDDRFVCVGAKSNRRLRRQMAAEEFASLPHIQVSVTGVGGGAVDSALEDLGLERTIAVKLPHFNLAPSFVLDSDLVLTIPERVLSALGDIRAHLKVVPVPVELAPLRVCLFWHERQHGDPAHKWLREKIVRQASALR